jgi:hypothetical protein
VNFCEIARCFECSAGFQNAAHNPCTTEIDSCWRSGTKGCKAKNIPNDGLKRKGIVRSGRKEKGRHDGGRFPSIGT